MTWKTKTALGLTALVVLVGALILLMGKGHSRPPVTVTLRISVTPGEQSGFVVARANSAQFKYLIGKRSGLKPVLAQKLSLQPVPNSGLLQATIGVLSQEEGRRYAEVFVDTLQELCGQQAQIALAGQSVR